MNSTLASTEMTASETRLQLRAEHFGDRSAAREAGLETFLASSSLPKRGVFSVLRRDEFQEAGFRLIGLGAVGAVPAY